MAATVDKGSIMARATTDSLVFVIDFDFTDDIVDPSQGWLVTWKHATFTYNTNMSDSEFNAAAVAAMNRARKPSAESNLETLLKTKFGIDITRTNPTPAVGEIMKVQIEYVSPTAVFRTQAV